MPDEFGEHLTRDHRPFPHRESLQILLIPRSMLVLLLSNELAAASQRFPNHEAMITVCLVLVTILHTAPLM